MRPAESIREMRLQEAIVEYIEGAEAGNPPDRQAFLNRYADLQQELQLFIDSRDRMQKLASKLSHSVNPQEPAPSATMERLPDSAFPVLASNHAASSPATIGQLGEYRLLREIGRGGMGVVYQAEQISLQRQVALKVLPFASALDARRLQRFKNEALAAASLRHENIVPVYAVGNELGVHYYAMQLIEGQSLAALIDALRLQAGQPSRHQDHDSAQAISNPAQPPLDSRSEMGETERAMATSIYLDRAAGKRHHYLWMASLFRKAALALDYAHQSGIVHRDIKPANLLLDAHGQLWITDFGLAQVGKDAGITVTGELLGTLRYASPEQTSVRPGIVDHRTDIYSLGATLYELLTLRPLFDGRDRNELFRAVANDTPTPPKQIVPAIPDELETIVLKAISKDPSERYMTAQELAEDLRRFEENLPILARKPNLVESLIKSAKRHSTMVIATSLVLFVMAIGFLTSTVLVQHAYTLERARADEAVSHFRLARRSVDELFRVSEEELANRPGTEQLRNRLLRSVLAYYQEFIEQKTDDSETQTLLIETKKRVEKILADLAVQRAAGALNLLNQPAVLVDLRLSEEQRVQIAELTQRVNAQFQQSLQDLGQITTAERSQRDLQNAKNNEERLKAILAIEQYQRLHQIGLQMDPAKAFQEPELAVQLNLTSQQRDQIRMIEEQGYLDFFKSIWPGSSIAQADKDRPRDTRPAHDRFIDVLTESQRQTWHHVTGEPFKGIMYSQPSPFAPISQD